MADDFRSSVEGALSALSSRAAWNYPRCERSCSEPAAWTALALAAHGELSAAERPARWLASLQQDDGSVGVAQDEPEPRWPTALAMLSWAAVDHWSDAPRFGENLRRGVAWSLSHRGKTAPQVTEVGHDTMLAGWSWAANTHSWLEPTCFFVLALCAAGLPNHPRAEEGLRLVHNRLLPDGGANYGNTLVYGQELLPHVQPTGIALTTLAGRRDDDGRIQRSIEYLDGAVQQSLSPESLAYGLMGLTAQGRRKAMADELVAARLSPELLEDLSAYDLALLLIAARPVADWTPMPRGDAVEER
jgi:hypothetical protein